LLLLMMMMMMMMMLMMMMMMEITMEIRVYDDCCRLCIRSNNLYLYSVCSYG
jgi:hypothetical protein